MHNREFSINSLTHMLHVTCSLNHGNFQAFPLLRHFQQQTSGSHEDLLQQAQQQGFVAHPTELDFWYLSAGRGLRFSVFNGSWGRSRSVGLDGVELQSWVAFVEVSSEIL